MFNSVSPVRRCPDADAEHVRDPLQRLAILTQPGERGGFASSAAAVWSELPRRRRGARPRSPALLRLPSTVRRDAAARRAEVVIAHLSPTSALAVRISAASALANLDAASASDGEPVAGSLISVDSS